VLNSTPPAVSNDLTDQAFIETYIGLNRESGLPDDLLEAQANSGLRKYNLFRQAYLKFYAWKWLQYRRDELYEKVCVQWRYCEKVKKYGDDVGLLLITADFGVAWLGVPGPFFLAWSLNKRLFDKLCRCAQQYAAQRAE
jgi:hypothetical protein